MTKKFGSRSEVFDDLCTMTRGGLTKDDLMLSKTGRIVSKRKSAAAKANFLKFGFKRRVVPEPEAPKKKKRKRRKKVVPEE